MNMCFCFALLQNTLRLTHLLDTLPLPFHEARPVCVSSHIPSKLKLWEIYFEMLYFSVGGTCREIRGESAP